MQLLELAFSLRHAIPYHTSFLLQVGSCETSPNQMLLAWTEDTVGGEKYTLHVKDLATGKELMAPIPMTSGDVVWANDNATLVGL